MSIDSRLLMDDPNAACYLLSGLAQTFQKEDAREKLLECETPDKLWKALIKATKTTIQ